MVSFFTRCFLSFLSIPICLGAYTFNSGSLGLDFGYRQDEMDWSFSSSQVAAPHIEKEDLDAVHIVELGIQGMYIESMHPYFRTKNCYGFSWSHESSVTLTDEVKSADAALTALIQEQANYSVSGHLWDSKTALGFAYRWGPITFAPLVGFSYEAQHFDRTKPVFLDFTNPDASISGTIGASKSLKFDLYLPLIGLDLLFQLGPEERFQLHTGYEYLLGVFSLRSSSFIDASILQSSSSKTTIKNTKTNTSVSRFAYANAFYLALLIGVLPECTLTLNFSYEARKAKVGNATQITRGKQTLITSGVTTTSSIYETTEPAFKGLFWQSFSGSLDLSWSF